MPQPADLLTAAKSATRDFSTAEVAALLEEPVIIVSVPRAGSTLLFEQMRRFVGLWSIGGESHAIFNAFPALRAENAAFDSGSLGAGHAVPEVCDLMRRCFLFLAADDLGRPFLQLPGRERPASLALLEKTPRNAINIPFLLEVFPRARFVYLTRAPQQNIASIFEAWKVGLSTGRFVTFRGLPGWDREAWCFLLPPGWRELRGRSLAEIASFQWAAGNRIIMDELQGLAPERWTTVSYEALTAEPPATLARLAEFAGVERPRIDLAPSDLPLSRTTLTPPDPDKWRRHEAELDELREVWAPVAERIAAL